MCVCVCVWCQFERCPPLLRYTRTEPFTALNIGVRFQHTLYESLDAFVQGELLEGNNKYHCEKCNKKVSGGVGDGGDSGGESEGEPVCISPHRSTR